MQLYKAMFEIGRHDFKSNGSKFGFLRIGFTIATFPPSGKLASWKEWLVSSAMIGARTLLHCFTSHDGAGSNSQCLSGAFWIMLAASSEVQGSKLANSGTSLGTMIGGARSAVRERMSLTLPSKNSANAAAECGLHTPPPGRSRQFTLLDSVFESLLSCMVVDQYSVNLRLKARRCLANCSRHCWCASLIHGNKWWKHCWKSGALKTTSVFSMEIKYW